MSAGLGIVVNGTTVSLDPTALDGSYWKRGGNPVGGVGTNRMGTTDNNSLDLVANNQNVLRLNADRTARLELNNGQIVEFGFVAGPIDKLITFSSGAFITPQGNVWAVSDRNKKENIRPVDARQVLEKVASLPVSTWNYIGTDVSSRQMGPMAQDFFGAFALGGDDQHINPLDVSSVALAAIQGLNSLVQEKQRQLDALEARISRLEAALNR